VTFRYKDYRHDAQQKTMTLEAEEFIRRFLLHVLPEGFQRIRYYGFLANRYREKKLALCRELLGMPKLEARTMKHPISWHERNLKNATRYYNEREAIVRQILDEIEKGRKELQFQQRQIDEAKRSGMDSFDSDKLLKN
jgi:Putative transposase